MKNAYTPVNTKLPVFQTERLRPALSYQKFTAPIFPDRVPEHPIEEKPGTVAPCAIMKSGPAATRPSG